MAELCLIIFSTSPELTGHIRTKYLALIRTSSWLIPAGNLLIHTLNLCFTRFIINTCTGCPLQTAVSTTGRSETHLQTRLLLILHRTTNLKLIGILSGLSVSPDNGKWHYEKKNLLQSSVYLDKYFDFQNLNEYQSDFHVHVYKLVLWNKDEILAWLIKWILWAKLIYLYIMHRCNM